MDALLILAFFILGAILASFTAVVAERAYTGESWVRGRSRCNSCARDLAALDLVPVVSWIANRGRCRTCKAHVPFLYALEEIVLGTLFALAYLTLGLVVALPVLLAALVVLAFVVIYDLRHTVVPPVASSLLIALGLLFAALTATSYATFGHTLLIAGVISLGFFLMFALSRGRLMGLGDAPVALALSLLVGASAAVPGLLFSFWIGAIVGIVILVTRPKGRRMGIEVPFVPFLAAGYLLAYFTQWNPLYFPW